MSYTDQKRIEKLRMQRLSLRCREAKLAHKIYRLGLRIARIALREQYLLARRAFLVLWQEKLLALEAMQPRLFASAPFQQKLQRIKGYWGNNEGALLKLENSKRLSNAVKLCLWESELSQIGLRIASIEATLALLLPVQLATEVAGSTISPTKALIRPIPPVVKPLTPSFGELATINGRACPLFLPTPPYRRRLPRQAQMLPFCKQARDWH